MAKKSIEEEVVPKRTPIMQDEPTVQDKVAPHVPLLSPERQRFAAYLERLTVPIRIPLCTRLDSAQAKADALTRILSKTSWDNPFRNSIAAAFSIVLGVEVSPGAGRGEPSQFHRGEMRVPLTAHNNHSYTVGKPVMIEAQGNGCVAGYTAEGKRGNDFFLDLPNSRPATAEEIIEFARVCDINKLTAAFGLIII